MTRRSLALAVTGAAAVALLPAASSLASVKRVSFTGRVPAGRRSRDGSDHTEECLPAHVPAAARRRRPGPVRWAKPGATASAL